MTTTHTDPTKPNRCPSCGRFLTTLPLPATPTDTHHAQLCLHCAQSQARAKQLADKERRLLGALHDAGKVMLP